MIVPRLLLPLTALVLALAACTAPSGGTPSATARLDALTPNTGNPGTLVEITGRIPAGGTLHLCGVPLQGLQLSDPETAGTHFGRAAGTVPSLTPGSTCTLTVVLNGQTIAHTGATLTFTTDAAATDDARLDTLTPTTGTPGTAVEVTGRIPAGATLHLCGVALADLILSDPETGAATHFGRATGTVPTLTPGSTCPLTVVRDGQTLPHTGATLTFTTDGSAPALPAAPANLSATTGNASVAIAFTVPDDGGSPITTLEYSLDGATWSPAAATSSPLQLAGLTNEQPITARLRVWTANGIGPASEPITATPTLWPVATSAGGPLEDVATSVSALPDGGFVTAGWFRGETSTFGATTLTSTSEFGYSAFVAKANADGSWAWAVEATSTNLAFAFGVNAVANGSAIVTGHFRGTATFGDIPLVGVSVESVFVAKIDPDGTWAWATSGVGAGSISGRGVATLADGSAIVTGYMRDTATFGDISLVSAGSADVFVAKTDPDGNWVWATRAGGSGLDQGRSVDTLADGSAIVTGTFEGTATFGATTLVSAGSYDVFVAKTDPDGNWVWATRAGGTANDQVRGVSALDDGSAIVSGSLQGTAIFGATTLTSAGNTDVFVAKTDPDGAWVWATRAGGSGADRGASVSVLADGSARITGDFRGSATFGATTLTSAGGTDVFVAKTDPDGTWAWATGAGGAGLDEALGVSTLADGSAVVTGSFSGGSFLGAGTFGATTLTTAGVADVFVAKVSTNPAW